MALGSPDERLCRTFLQSNKTIDPHDIAKHTLTGSFTLNVGVLDGMYSIKRDHSGADKLDTAETASPDADQLESSELDTTTMTDMRSTALLIEHTSVC